MPTQFGQNFLINEEISKRIIKEANIKGNNILEIGPGKGILTQYLVEKTGRVLAIELDRNLLPLLEKKFSSQKNISLIQSDILKINLPKLIKENNFQNYKVVANLPYYITSKIIRLLLETKYPPSEIILMIQKEVAERICAKPRQESLLSISVKFYGEPEILFDVSRENFNPVPEVDSAVIHITRKKNPLKADTSDFFSLVRAGFSSKRKMLLNNLSASSNLSKDKVSEILKKAGIEPAQRAQELELKDWLRLYQIWPVFRADQKRK